MGRLEGKVAIVTGAAGGITAAMVFGFLCALIAKPGDKA